MSIPTIGFTADAGVRIELGDLLERRLLIQAGSGAGKSTLLRSFVEQLAGTVQQFVIDTEGDLVTLRDAGDFVIVGVGADVPPDLKTVKLLARRLMELGTSVIFDLSGLNVAARRDYVKHLFDELSYMPRALWHPLVVWLDEGHVFAPQSDSATSTSAVATAAATWRKRGYCLVVATQRLSKLDKDVAAELHNKIIGFTDDVDVKRAGDQLGMTAEQRDQLQELQPHEFFAKGPGISRMRIAVRTRMPKTSPPPKGQVRTSAPPPPEKVRAILSQLADLAKESEEEARTTDDLRRALAERDRRIRQLEKGGAERVVEKPVIDRAAIDRAVGAARAQWSRELAEIIGRKVRTLRAKSDRATTSAADLAATVADLEAALAVPSSSDVRANAVIHAGNPGQPLAAEQRGNPLSPATSPSGRTAVRPNVAPVGIQGETAGRDRQLAPTNGIRPAQQKILNALAELEVLGVDAPSRTQLGFFAAYNLTGGTGGQHVADLVSAGLAQIPRAASIQLTAAGRSIATTAGVPRTLDELHVRILANLSDSQRKIAEYLIKIYPESMSRTELGEAVNYNLIGGTGGQHIADLVTAGIAKIPAKGHVIASDLLFPEALS